MGGQKGYMSWGKCQSWSSALFPGFSVYKFYPWWPRWGSSCEGSKKDGKSRAKEPHGEKRIQFKGHERSHKECGQKTIYLYICGPSLDLENALIRGSQFKSHHLDQTFLPALLMLCSLWFTTHGCGLQVMVSVDVQRLLRSVAQLLWGFSVWLSASLPSSAQSWTNTPRLLDHIWSQQTSQTEKCEADQYPIIREQYFKSTCIDWIIMQAPDGVYMPEMKPLTCCFEIADISLAIRPNQRVIIITLRKSNEEEYWKRAHHLGSFSLSWWRLPVQNYTVYKYTVQMIWASGH